MEILIKVGTRVDKDLDATIFEGRSALGPEIVTVSRCILNESLQADPGLRTEVVSLVLHELLEAERNGR